MVMKNACLLFLPIYLLLVMEGLSQDSWKDVYSERTWTDRDAWQRPDDIIKQLGISKGSAVADIGCHEGYFTMKLASVVGPNGKVYAVDISRDKIEKVRANAKERNFDNVVAIVGDEANPKLPVASLDAVLIVDTYHEMDKHQEILSYIKASLKASGKLLICEPIADERKNLSRDVQEKRHELGMQFALDDLQAAGFKVISKHEGFVDRRKEKGDTMWLIVAVKEKL